MQELIKELVEAAAGKEKTQVDEFNRKVTDISENTSFLERLKDAVISSGDASAEALINDEINLFLQGAASDFEVDAEIHHTDLGWKCHQFEPVKDISTCHLETAFCLHRYRLQVLVLPARRRIEEVLGWCVIYTK